MAKMGRPPKEINQREFEALCEMQCTEEEICGVLGVTDKTLVSWTRRTYGLTFSEAIKRFSARTKKSLRRWQLESAKKGNATMLIWLGKQYLGQRDLPEDNVDTEDSEAYFDEAGV
jgi:hypothetical protein